VSALTPRCSRRIRVTRLTGMSNAPAKARADRPSSASSSRRISPGWIGRIAHSIRLLAIVGLPQSQSTISTSNGGAVPPSKAR
jgi:hypothetical protein